MLFVGRKGKNSGHFQRVQAACLLCFERFVIALRRIHAADGKHGVEAFAARIQAVRFLPELVQDILRDFADAFGVKQGLAVFGGTQFLLVLFRFHGFELRTHIVVIHFEFQYFFIADGIGNHIRMQLPPEHARRGFRAQSVFGKNRRTGKAELAKFLEFLFQVFLRFAELRAVAFVENKYNLLVINRQIIFTFHQVVQLLDGGNDDFVVVFFQIAFQARRAFRTVHTVGRKTLVFLHCLIVQILPIHHEENLVDKRRFRRQTRRLKAGQRFTAARGMPNIAAAFRLAPILRLRRTVDFPQNAFGGGDLIRTHNQQRIIRIKHAVMQQNAQQYAFLQERGGEVFQILNRIIVRPCPIHREIEAVFVALGGVGEIARVRAVGNHEDLQEFEQRIFAVEALFAVTVHLIECFTHRHAALFQFDLHQRQAVYQHGNVIAVCMRARLLKLVDNLHMVAGKVFLVQQINVFQTAVIKSEIINMVVVDFAGFVGNIFRRPVQIFRQKPRPFVV